MPDILEALKVAQPVSSLKFDDGCNAAVRANNETICLAAEESPASGGNVAKLQESQGEVEITAHEYSYFKYEGASAEELVALFLYQDFDRHAAQSTAEKGAKDAAEAPKEGEESKPVAPTEAAKVVEACKSGLLDESATALGISNKSHSKCVNTIQMVLMCTVVNQMV